MRKGRLKSEKDRSKSPAILRESPLPPLNWLRGYEATARIGSFTGAAEALGLSQAAVSYQVRCLEQHLGLSLFERQAHGVKLTELGQAFLPPVQKAFDEIAAATVGLFGAHGDLSLVIRTHPSFAALWLAPRLGAFRTLYPRIPVRIYSAIWGSAVPAEDVDVEVRFGDGKWPGFSAEKLDGGPVIAVGQKRASNSSATRIAALRGETLIEIMEIDDAWSRLFASAGLAPPRKDHIIRVDSTHLALELVSAGVGHAIVFRSMAAPYLKAGKIVDLGLLERPGRLAHYILRPLGRQREKPEARLFTQWLKAEVAGEQNPTGTEA